MEKVETQTVLEAQIVEKVGFDNFFHHFYDSKDFHKNSWKKWKKLSKTTFSTTQAVLEAEIVEKVGFDNFFHHFYGSKDILNTIRGKVEIVVKTNIFHDSGRFGGPNRGKSWPGQLSTRFTNTFHA